MYSGTRCIVDGMIIADALQNKLSDPEIEIKVSEDHFQTAAGFEAVFKLQGAADDVLEDIEERSPPTQAEIIYGFSRQRCADLISHSHCQAWKDEGLCTQHARWMAVNCPRICGFCLDKVMCDESEGCALQAVHGICTENPDISFKTCPISCGLFGELCSSECFSTILVVNHG